MRSVIVSTIAVGLFTTGLAVAQSTETPGQPASSGNHGPSPNLPPENDQTRRTDETGNLKKDQAKQAADARKAQKKVPAKKSEAPAH